MYEKLTVRTIKKIRTRGVTLYYKSNTIPAVVLICVFVTNKYVTYTNITIVRMEWMRERSEQKKKNIFKKIPDIYIFFFQELEMKRDKERKFLIFNFKNWIEQWKLLILLCSKTLFCNFKVFWVFFQQKSIIIIISTLILLFFLVSLHPNFV